MEIMAQLCGIVLVMTISVLFQVQRRINLCGQKKFRIILSVVLASIFCDALSIIAIKNANESNMIFVNAICKIYLVTLLLEGYVSFSYFVYEVIPYYKKLHKAQKIASTYVGVCAFCIVLAPISIHCEADGIYTYGPCVIFTYISALLFVIINLVILNVCEKNMDENRRTVGFLWMIVWVIAAIIQFINNNVLLVGYASAIGVSILYMRLENPGSYIDRETGLLNDHALHQYIKEWHNEKKIFCMLIIDIEYANIDIDKTIKNQISKQISHFFDAVETIVAFKNQGFEYTLLIENTKDSEETINLVKERFDQMWVVDGEEYDIRYKIFDIKKCDANEDELIEIARTFVGEHKNLKKRKILTMDEQWFYERKRRIEVSKIIVDAIKKEQIEVYYQPIYDYSTKNFSTAEALVRIVQDDGNIIPPNTFIPVAERNGMVSTIGEIVFKKACLLLMQEKLWERGVEYLEINISAVQSIQPEFADKYIQIMKETKVDPKMINLEITESAALQSQENLLENMKRLIDFGVSFSLDDFGTGYSNLNYVLELPVNIVKFDRKMTMAYFLSEKGRIIMHSAINMIKAVNIRIVAEGIETDEQVEGMEKEGIDYIQGFYFSKPLNTMDYLQFLERHGQ